MKKAIIYFVLLALPGVASAWNGIGHSTAGALTYLILKKDNPAALQKIFQTLTKHPWYNNKWHTVLAGLTPAQKEVALFMLASTFPDDARTTPYDHPSWHYINYPFAPAGQGGTPRPSPVPNAETQIGMLMNTLRTAPENADKAVGICWLLHLVEDIHQPLHSTAMYTSTFPKGDRGGGLIYIKLRPNGGSVKLHSYWDGLIKGNFNTIPALAQQRLSDPQYALARLNELTLNPKLNDWLLKESFVLAKSVAYANGRVNGDIAHPVLVDQAYADRARIIAERRIVLSGYRLAGLLSAIYVT